LGISEMWCRKRVQQIIWTYRVRNKEILPTVNEERNILYTVKRRKADLIDQILRRNSLIKSVIEGKIEKRIEVRGR
jgi:hypothetical protein